MEITTLSKTEFDRMSEVAINSQPLRKNVELTSNGLVLMTLEDGIQPPPGRSKNEELRNQLRNLFENMKVGQSFVVPRKVVHIIHYLINSEFESYRIRTSSVSPDKQFFRIFRIA